MVSIDEIIEREKTFWDSRAERFVIDVNYAKNLLAFDSPAAEFANRLPRLKKNLHQALNNVNGKHVLVYGCGNDNAAIWFSKSGAIVDAFDISPKSIENQKLIAEHLNLKINALVMDAHKLNFPSNKYDIVYGNAILHHLALQEAIPEIARVLKPGGKAIFRDILGGNVFLRAFRFTTSSWRTPDQHPLLSSDFDLFAKVFSKCQIEQYVLSSIPYVSFIKIMNIILKKLRVKNIFPLHGFISKNCDRIDTLLFRFIPILKYQAWLCLIIVEKD